MTGVKRATAKHSAKKLPRVIPPETVVRLARADAKTPAWARAVGRRFQVGYYSRSDGLECIWLVNYAGEYEQTTDRQSLLKYFDIEELSSVEDLYGDSFSPPTLRKLSHERAAG